MDSAAAPMKTRSTLTSGYASRSSSRLYDARFESRGSHFLESCFLCNKRLAKSNDIFMYKGDVPFCSEACRQEQMESDVAKEKRKSMSSMKALRNKEQMESTSQSATKEYTLRPGPVVAA